MWCERHDHSDEHEQRELPEQQGEHEQNEQHERQELRILCPVEIIFIMIYEV